MSHLSTGLRCYQTMSPFRKVNSYIQNNLHILSKKINWGRKLLLIFVRKNQEQRRNHFHFAQTELYGQLPNNMDGCMSVSFFVIFWTHSGVWWLDRAKPMQHHPYLYPWTPVPSTALWLHMDCLWEWSPPYESFSDMPRNNLGMRASWRKPKACQSLFSNQ